MKISNPITNCRTLFFFMLLMCYAIKVTGNLMGAETDAFLSTLLPVFDCFLLTLISAGLKRIRLGFVIPILVTAVLFGELFTIFFYHSNFTTYVILLLFETNPQESSEFIRAALRHPGTWYAALLTLVLAGIAHGLSRLSRKPFRHQKIAVFIAFGLIAWSGIRQLSSYGKLLRCLTSFSTTVCNTPDNIPHLNTPFVRLAYGIAFNTASSAELDVLEQSVRAAVVDSCSYRCPLIVLVIGESYNKHHAQLYGYPLPTTPRLQQLVNDSLLTLYTNAVAPFNFTSNAFKRMFSTWDESDADEWTNHSLFPALFRQAGYQVDFFTNQFAAEQSDIWDVAGGTIFNHHGLSQLQFTVRNTHVYPYDGDLLAELPPADSLGARPTLLIVHLIGQHVSYDTRYPSHFTRFTASDEQTPFGGMQGKQTAAHYDNATYYNDSVVHAIFNHVRAKNAIGIYLSDHGEEVYDWRNQYERTNESTLCPEVAHYQYEIPFMFFMTDSFQVCHPEMAEAVRASADRRFFSSDLPHLLLYLGGISTAEYQEKRNILSPKYDLKRKRIIRNDVDYDELMKR